MHTVERNNKGVKPKTLTIPKPAAATNAKDEISDARFSGVAAVSSARRRDTNTGRDDGKAAQKTHTHEQTASSRLNIRDNHRGPLATRHPLENDFDPVTAFMILRSRHTALDDAAPQSSGSAPGTDCFFCHY